MISNTIKQIADALATLFPLNLFLINEDGIIQWVNEHMLKAANQPELKAIQGKHVRMFGEKEWLTTKSVITSKKNLFYSKMFVKKISSLSKSHIVKTVFEVLLDCRLILRR
jgi:c-di-AMP phosphodiesterase-like protein